MSSHSQAPDRPTGARRLPSGPWTRTTLDPLDVYGLPSKGETKLNDFQVQEAYYHKIVERYMQVCATAGSSQELERRLASVSIAESAKTTTQTRTTPESHQSKQKTPMVTEKVPLAATRAEMAIIIHAMRKLREALVASARRDMFAQRAYVFLVRSSLLLRLPEAYHPALLHLLRIIHLNVPLGPSEMREFVGFAILDAACRRENFQEAYELRQRYALKDRMVDRVLRALTIGDWVTFWRARDAVDGHARALLDFAAPRMRTHALKCLGRTYMTAERGFVEASCGGRPWGELVNADGVGWELEAGTGPAQTVRIRRPKTK